MEVQTNLLIDACQKCIADLADRLDEAVEEYNTLNNGNFFTRLFGIHKPLEITGDYNDLYDDLRTVEDDLLVDEIRQLIFNVSDAMTIGKWLLTEEDRRESSFLFTLDGEYDFLIPYIEKNFQVVY